MITYTIHGEAASKSNSPKLSTVRSKKSGKIIPVLSSSDEAKQFKADCARFTPILSTPWTCDVTVTCVIYYRTRRRDLDASLIYDCMQKKIIKNDRQIKTQHTFWALDPDHPRVEVTVEPWQGEP